MSEPLVEVSGRVGNANGIPLLCYDRSGTAIFQGDCLEVMPSLPDASFDLVLTDPPYGVSYRGNHLRKGTGIVGDDSDLSWLTPAFVEMYRLLKPDSFAVTFYGWPNVELFVEAFEVAGFRRVSHLVCVKDVWGLGKFSRSEHETAFLLAKGTPKLSGKAIGDVLAWRRVRRPIHPNEKPIGPLMRFIEAYCPESGKIIDPFMGSGSAIEAARLMGRQAIGIEIDPEYVGRAVKRLQKGDLFQSLEGYGTSVHFERDHS